jgi:hypothetical protein
MQGHFVLKSARTENIPANGSKKGARKNAQKGSKRVSLSLQGQQGLDDGFLFHGQRIRESTGTRSKTLALKIEDKSCFLHLQPFTSSNRKQEGLLTLPDARCALFQSPAAIEAREVARYQQKRLDEEASPKTINLEIGTLRAIQKRSGQWARLQPDVKMLTTRDDVGRAITAEEEAALLQACSQSRSRSLVPFVTLAIETGPLTCRFHDLRHTAVSRMLSGRRPNPLKTAW